jgi:excinuclease UvrABC ATPase subunit
MTDPALRTPADKRAAGFVRVRGAREHNLKSVDLDIARDAPPLRRWALSFNVSKGRCETCDGEGFFFAELLFLPSVYAPSCRARRR